MLTAKGHKALLFIEGYMARTGGIAPRVSDLADHMGGCRSKAAAQRLMIGLEQRGFIRRLPARARAIEVIRPVSRFAVFQFDNEAKTLHRRPDA